VPAAAPASGIHRRNSLSAGAQDLTLADVSPRSPIQKYLWGRSVMWMWGVALVLTWSSDLGVCPGDSNSNSNAILSFN